MRIPELRLHFLYFSIKLVLRKNKCSVHLGLGLLLHSYIYIIDKYVGNNYSAHIIDLFTSAK